jgi:exonuclease SbcD
MRIGHCADLHLGHQRYHAVTPEGRNQREQDVSNAWFRAVDGIVEAAPDLLFIAGDVFDVARPTNYADDDAAAGIAKLRAALPKMPIVIITGNHDGVRAEAGSPVAALAHAGVKIVLRATRISIPQLDAHVLAVPECDVEKVALEPSKDSGTHILLAHGKFSAALYRLPAAKCLSPDSISPDFALAALGDFHVASQVGPRAFYSGALEAVSSNAWGEIGTAYGWNLFDTETGTLTRYPIATRVHIDLPQFGANGMTPKEISERIVEQLTAAALDGAVIRQVVHDVSRGMSQALDYRAFKKLTGGVALNFHLDCRRPETVTAGRQWVMDLKGDDGPDWIDAMNAEDLDPLPQSDQYTYADAIARGENPFVSKEAAA